MAWKNEQWVRRYLAEPSRGALSARSEPHRLLSASWSGTAPTP